MMTRGHSGYPKEFDRPRSEKTAMLVLATTLRPAALRRKLKASRDKRKRRPGPPTGSLTTTTRRRPPPTRHWPDTRAP